MKARRTRRQAYATRGRSWPTRALRERERLRLLRAGWHDDDGGGYGAASGTAIALLPDGSFAVAAVLPGTNGPSFGVARYTSAGVLDDSFGSGGLTALSFGDQAVAQAIAIDGDGRILVAGIVGGASVKKAVVARLWP